MNWIRIDAGIASDPKLHTLAESLKVTVPHAVGLVVGVLTRMPAHARDGNLSGITDGALEQWAGWTGKPRGGFSRAFRATFCDTDGVVTAWEKYNGAAIRSSDRNREKQQRHRDRANAHRADDARNPLRNPLRNPSRNPLRNGETGRDETIQNYNSSSTPLKEARALFVLPNRGGAA
jgi:hypothetical protein